MIRTPMINLSLPMDQVIHPLLLLLLHHHHILPLPGVNTTCLPEVEAMGQATQLGLVIGIQKRVIHQEDSLPVMAHIHLLVGGRLVETLEDQAVLRLRPEGEVLGLVLEVLVLEELVLEEQSLPSLSKYANL